MAWRRMLAPCAAVLLSLVLVGCAAIGDPVALVRGQLAEPRPPDLVALRSDGRQAELRWDAAEAKAGEIDRARAESLARIGAGSGADGVPADEARLVVLTELTPDDQATTIDRRRVWLVTMKGASFPIDACACDGTPLKLGTLVAVGADDGAVVASYGISRD